MGRMRLVAGLLVAGLTLGVLLAGTAAASASPGAETEFVSEINAARAGRGLAALRIADDLVAVARRHSERMAEDGRLFHNTSLAREVAGWQSLAENVGTTAASDSSVAEMHGWFMESDGHRANILNPDIDQIGVGVVVRDGTMWVTEVFVERSAASPTVSASKATSAKTPATTSAGRRTGTSRSSDAKGTKRTALGAERRAAIETPRNVAQLVRLRGFDAEMMHPN